MLNHLANMGQRNIVCTSQMPDLEMDQQGPGNLHSEHCIFLGNIAHYPHPNLIPMLSASGNTSNIDLRCLPEHHEGRVFYSNQFNGLQPHHPMANFNLGAPSNYYNPYMIPLSLNRIGPVPLNRGSSDQPLSLGNQGITGVVPNDYDGSNHFMDGVRSSGKRKNAEGFPGSHVASGSASSSSSSLGILQNTGLPQLPEGFESGAGMLDVTSFQQLEYRTNNGIPSIAGTSRRSVRSRSSDIGIQVDSNLMHNQNHMVQGNFMGQSFQPTGNAWVEQQLGSNGSDGVSSTWNSSSPMPYMHGRNVSGASLDITSMSGQGYPPETMNGRSSSAILLHPSSMQHHHFPHHLHSPPIQSMQGHNYHPQASIPSFRNPTSNALSHGSLNPYLDGQESGPRYPRPFPSNGLRIYRPHRSGMRQTAAPENSNHPHLRVLSEDGVAILEIPGFYEVGNLTDQHRDMRLDIDDMSYEELLALGERIGNVKTGLPEENISRCLKTRTHYSSYTEDMDLEMEGNCIICQLEYENQDMVGVLECGHEYHADCIKQWLVLKNVCPICKMPALTMEDGMDDS